jgi:hypothetical protein
MQVKMKKMIVVKQTAVVVMNKVMKKVVVHCLSNEDVEVHNIDNIEVVGTNPCTSRHKSTPRLYQKQTELAISTIIL